MSPSTNCSSIASTSSSSDARRTAAAVPFDAAAGPSPCTDCGACCASFRVSFYWGEADDAPGGWVPVRFTQPLSPVRRAMVGTDARAPRCAALVGEVGRHVGCAIYAHRPSPCREFDWRDPSGRGVDPRCTDARARHGLPPLGDDGRAPGGSFDHTGASA